MTSETLARRGPGAGWWPWGRGDFGARHDGVWVSMVLTSQAHRRRTLKENRRIPTIPVESFGGGLVDVSTVDRVGLSSFLCKRGL